MRSVSPAQQVFFWIWMFLFLPKLLKNKVIDKRGFVLTMENSYLNCTKQIYSSYVGSHHVQCVVYICLSQKQHPTADRIQNESRNRTTISLSVNHFNKTILYAFSEKNLKHWDMPVISNKLTPKKSESPSPSVQGPKSYS